MSKAREPIFNIPAIVVVVLVALALVHIVRVYLLSPEADRLLLLNFAFIPARLEWSEMSASAGEFIGALLSFVSYAFIHADITHLGFNSIWLVAFGTPVARRFGSVRFLAFFALTAAAGALAFLISNFGDLSPMIGASASISGTMGASARFAFQRGGPLDRWGARDDNDYRIPAAPLSVAMRDPRVLGFVGVWFVLNLVFGLGALSFLGEDQVVAWEAHVGGFFAGLLLFALFDPVRPRSDYDDDQSASVIS